MSVMLITLSELRTFLEIPSGNTDSDSFLVSIITDISERIQTYLNRKLTQGYYNRYFNAGKKKYWVDAYPISTGEGITVTYSDVVEEINDDYYVWEDEGLIEFDFITTYTEPKDVYIEWFGGYPTTITANTSSTITITYTDSILLYSVPNDLKLACKLQAAYVYRRRRDIGLFSVDTHDGKYGVKGTMELLPEVKSILNSYRKPATGK
jgi:hypothetical protein